MTTIQYLLNKVIEECLEVGQTASKSIRFGLNGKENPDSRQNCQLIMDEYADLVAIIEDLQSRALLPDLDRELVEAKKKKLNLYLQHSKELGHVKD